MKSYLKAMRQKISDKIWNIAVFVFVGRIKIREETQDGI